MPPKSLLSSLVFFPLAAYFDLFEPDTVLLLLLGCCLPLASLGAKVEQKLRSFQVCGYHKLMQALNAGTKLQPVMRGIVQASAWRHLCCSILLYIVALAFAGGVLLLYKQWLGNLSVPLGIDWSILWLIGAAGGVLALRLRSAVACFIVCFLLFGCYFEFLY